MSANHKRPLLAFVLVALACSMIIANGVRSQAVVTVVRAGAQHLVSGVELVVADAPREPAALEAEPQLTPLGSVEVAAQQVFGGGHTVPRAAHETTREHHPKVDRDHSRSRETPHGHGKGHAKGHAKSDGKKPGKGHLKDRTKGLVDHPGKGGGKKPGKGHVTDHVTSLLDSLGKRLAKGHDKGHDKGHGKGHGKG